MQVMYQLSEFYNDLLKFSSVNTPLEVKTLDKIFKKSKVKWVLDIACGVGRHSIPLSKMGYSVVGIDYSPYQIKEARKQARKQNSPAKFYLKNANNFKFPNRFDAAICMWSTLGEEPMQYPKVIKNVYSVLRSKGIFIIDNRNWEAANKNEAPGKIVFKRKGLILKRKMWDRYTDHFRIRQAIIEVNGKKYDELCVTHLLNTKEWLTELKRAGFKKFEIFHDYQRKRLKKPSRVLIVAHK